MFIQIIKYIYIKRFNAVSLVAFKVSVRYIGPADPASGFFVAGYQISSNGIDVVDPQGSSFDYIRRYLYY